jgi:hypothetical protein
VLHMSRQRRRSEGAVDGHGAESSFGPIQLIRPRLQKETGFRTEIQMRKSSESSLQSSFMHARRLSFQIAAERLTRPFPYGHVWPPPSVPTDYYRVLGAGLDRPGRLRPEDSAVRRREVYTGAFRIRKWLDMWDHWHPVSQFVYGGGMAFSD